MGLTVTSSGESVGAAGTITKGQIVAAVNARLGLSMTVETLADQVNGALRELSGMAQWRDLRTQTDADIAAFGTAVAIPAGMRLLDRVVTVNVAGRESGPLELLEYHRLLTLRAGAQIPGHPRGYCLRAANIELWPAANADYTVRVWHWRFHPVQDAILFSEEFREIIYAMTIRAYLQDAGLADSSRYAQATSRVGELLLGLLPAADQDATAVKYRDIF